MPHSSLPVYTEKWPFQNLLEMARHPIRFSDKVFDSAGDSALVKVPMGYFVMTRDPGFIKHTLQTNQKNYKKDPGYDQLALFLGQGLVTSEGDLWRKQRRIAQPSFYKTQLEELYKDMVKVAESFVEELGTKEGEVIDISQQMMAVTAKIAMKALFSRDMTGGLVEIYEAISFGQEHVISRIMNPLSIPLSYINGKKRKFRKKKQLMDELVTSLIEQRGAGQSQGNDFLQMLMDARYEDTGEPMEQRQLLDELVTIFSAGHETSSNGMTWLFYLLSDHPEVVQRLREEQMRVSGHQLPAFSHLRQLTYHRQVIEESMRLYPPVWTLGRQAIAADEWEGNQIKKGMIITCAIFHLHRNPHLWENPERFDPDRFSAEQQKSRPKSHYLPFGAGPRMCIGNHFAMMEMQLLLAAMIHRFDFELIKDQRIDTEPLITLRPRYGMNMRIRKASSRLRDSLPLES
ncbi:MAG: cytochrome P450 [Bacteroidota bacterium]